MYEFETVVDFIGESRPCMVSWDHVDGECVIRGAEIVLSIRHDYRPDGRYSPYIERNSLNIKDILSDDQVWRFVEEIRAAARKGQAEDFHESKMMDYDERKYRKAA